MPRGKNGGNAAVVTAALVAPATPPLEGCKVVLCGSFPKLSQATLKQHIDHLGGKVLNSVTADATHLIVTAENYKKPTAKVKAAQAQAIFVVDVEWLLASVKANQRQAEGQFLMNAAPTTAAPAAATAAPPPPAAALPAPGVGSTKRKRGADNASAAAPARAPAKRQKTAKTDGKGGGVIIPVDEACTMSNVTVYVGDDGVVWDASLNQTNSGQNNNKFYRIQVLCAAANKFITWTRWGRVGERGQSAVLGGGGLDDAKRNFEKKFRDKSGLAWDRRTEDPRPGKYAFVERNYNEDEDEDENDDSDIQKDETKKEDDDYVPPVCTLTAPVQSLMELIFNRQFFAATMSDLNYDANKLPLGKLSKTTISRGFQALKDLSALIDDQTLATTVHNLPYAHAVEQLSNMYYSVIPHAFGRNRPPVIGAYALLKKEIELLESLSDMKDAELLMKADKGSAAERSTVHPADKHYQALQMEEVTALDPKGEEYKQLSDYLLLTCGATHNVRYKVQDIFRIERKGEKARFEACTLDSAEAQDSDTRLLWHGSRVTNFGGILGQGLRIAPPEAPVSGYMFGKGIYLADMSSKSAGYCASSISGGTGLLLLCEAKLGSPLQKLTQASYNAGDDAKAKGLFATLGQGRTAPPLWKDASAVHDTLKGVQMPDVSSLPTDTNVPNAGLYYNEYIVYNVNQVRLRYLFRVRM
ncbi:hypothetical protein SEPCBS119000_006292 [Sporothrix epigloea]|uniref:Poly [ADP-ribose] polymerase n=1 Tax=Sporothrix epigloea TaxID=1892477 RepID=A0ABP0E280_9PEZI